MIFAALSAIGSIMGAQQQAAAMRRQAERQEFQGQLELLRGQQMHNDRVEAYQAFANQINTAVAFNNRSQSDRSFQAIKKAGFTNGKDVSICLDVAANELINKEKYSIHSKKYISVEQSIQKYLTLIKKYKIKSIEDPFAENDWSAWTKFVSKTKNKEIPSTPK